MCGCASKSPNPPDYHNFTAPLDINKLSGDQGYDVMIHYFDQAGEPKSLLTALLYRDSIWYVVVIPEYIPDLIWVTDINQFLIGYAKKSRYTSLYRFDSIVSDTGVLR